LYPQVESAMELGCEIIEAMISGAPRCSVVPRPLPLDLATDVVEEPGSE
jgi:hypothetical protein